ncbi:MAG: lipid A export permease/ATP-binding protein MsbA [Methylococcales bacterium]|nr:lipid A export permease/ATP-binding protein MsbA [Methylococcales bacterium]MBT7444746.1 lipid A export permease/ATP-binding protein MsbA [Methylococcales bacterium]
MKASTIKQSIGVYFRLLTYVKPHWKIFALSILGFLIYSSSQPALAWIMGRLTDAIYTKNASATYLIPLALIGIYFVRGIGGFLGNYFLAKVTFSIVQTLRNAIVHNFTTLPNGFFEQHNSGHLISSITFNVTQVTGAATGAVKVILREGITVIALLAMIFYYNWQLSLTFIAIAPLIGLVVSYASKRFRKISGKIQVSMGEITQVSSEVINGYKEVKSFGGQDYEKQRFEKASHRNYKQNLKMVLTQSINTPVLQMIVAFALSFLVFLALSMTESMNPEAFIVYITAAGLLPKPIRQLSEVNSTIQKGIAAAESIFALLDEPSEQNTGKHTSTRARGLLEFQQLTFQYPNSDTPVIKNLNLTIEPGQTVALVGSSGSGKSTLANLIPRFYEPKSGQILLDGTPLQDYELNNLRTHISLVTQQVTLFNGTIKDNIAYGGLQHHTLDDVKKAACQAYASEFIDKQTDSYNTLVGEDGVLLSGGQRQRLAIARALLKDAPLLILDEATSALDNTSEKHIQAALKAVMRNRTTLVIAHRLTTIESADIIIVMDHGSIIEQGSHDELYAKQGAYYQLHQAQVKQDAEKGDQN